MRHAVDRVRFLCYTVCVIDDWLRKVKEVVIAAPARLLNRFLSPLAMTLLAFAVTIVASYLLWQGFYRWAMWLWIVSRVLDGFDGTMARLSGRQSALGGYLDLMCDVVVYALFPIAAALAHGGEQILIALAVLLGSYYINLTSWAILSAILEKRALKAGGSNRRMTTVLIPRSIIEGFETAVIYGLFCLFMQVLWYIFIGTAILVMLGVCIRIVWAVRNRAILEESGS